MNIRPMQSRDVISGLLSPVVIITSTVSYAALIFSGPVATALPLGIGNGLITAGLMAIAFAAFSTVPFSIAGPDSKTVAVLAALGSIIAADVVRRGHADAAGTMVLIAVVVGTLVTGATLYLFGVLRTGRWIRFVPYPVIGGFMAASGWLLASGGIRLLTGTPVSLKFFTDVLAGGHVINLAVGFAFAVAIHLIRKIKHFLAFPALLIGGTAATHLALLAVGFSLPTARQAGWLLDIDEGTLITAPALFLGPGTHLDLGALVWQSGQYIALVAVTATTLLLSLVSIELETGIEVDLDRELRLNGIANVVAGLCGGMVGTLSVGRTLFNYRAGARHRLSGVLAGVICLLVLAFGTKPLGLIPVPILGGLLLQLGGDLLDDWLVKGWRLLQRTDYVQVIIIFLVIAWWDFVAGVAVGIISASITFAFNTSRVRLVKLGLNRSNYGSRVDRPSYQLEELVRHGGAIQIMWLHGFVFFASAHRLTLHVKDIIAAQGAGGCSSLVLDFRQVLGIDSSAVLSLIRLRQLAEREGFVIALSDLPAAVERALRVGGLLHAEDEIVRVFPDVDSALEWCEDRLLAVRMSREEALRSADDWLAGEIGSPELFARLASYLEVVDYQPGELMFEQGAPADCLYLLYTGRVTVTLQTPSGGELRLRSMVGHTIIGEMGIYRAMPRGAAVKVDMAATAYRLSSEAIRQMEEDDPALAYAFHRFVIRTLAARLDFANREIAGLQR
jgi:SulP family sulfate permease